MMVYAVEIRKFSNDAHHVVSLWSSMTLAAAEADTRNLKLPKEYVAEVKVMHVNGDIRLEERRNDSLLLANELLYMG